MVAATVTEAVDVPTIGIGAGPGCDGQVLVFHDLLGPGQPRPPPKFVRRYADLAEVATAAVAAFAADVRGGAFPGEAESYHAPDELREALGRRAAAGTGGVGGGRGARTVAAVARRASMPRSAGGLRAPAE